jgi:dTDP-4-dehydrorhamnose reductase
VVIHYSTDYVFDGLHGEPYPEDHPTAPCNVYGASKLAGERLLAERCPQHLILRTSWVYSLRGSNFLLTMLRLSQERPELRIVADQIGAPTSSRYIAERTAALVARYVVQSEDRTRLRCAPGIVHLTAGGSTSWADFAREIFRIAERSTTVVDIPASAYATAATRPANSRLDCSKLAGWLGCPGESWQEGLSRCLKGDG